MRQADLGGIGQHGRINFVFGADDDIDQAQDRAEGDAKGAGIIPLVGTEVDIQCHWCTSLVRRFGRKERRTTAWLLAQPSTANQ